MNKNSPATCSVKEQHVVPAVNKDLRGLFRPESVAVVGASTSPEKIGHQIFKNIAEGGFGGKIFPVHPKADEILGHKVYPSIKDIPCDVDFVVICIPASLVVSCMQECANKGVKAVAVITSGFAEVGNVEEEQKLKEIADKHNIALLGPNILGIVYTPSNLNASFGPPDLLPGKIAFISQSGALAIALMGWTVMEKMGLASLVSIGNKADIDEKALIEYFNDDENVDVIMIYMEGLKDGREFLKTKIKKPVVILKVGRSERGAKAAASHTGSLAGSDKVFDGAFKQLGVLRVDSFTQSFDWSRVLSSPPPKGRETVIITNGGGIGVRATDECEASGIKLLEDNIWLEEKFRCTMPDFGSTKNPIDITGGAHGKEYREAAKVALDEDRIHACFILYCETVVTDPMEIAESIYEEYQASNRSKPLVLTMVGGERTRAAIHYLNEKGIPAFTSVKETVSSLRVVYEWAEISRRKQDNYEHEEAPQKVVGLIEKAKKENRSLMEHEAREILELCGVSTPKWGFARDIEEAMSQAKDMYPLAMKIASPDIIHKTDVGGVDINIRNEEDLVYKYTTMMTRVKKAAPDATIMGVNLVQMIEGIECITGLSSDPQFGPIVMFGLGGVFVEVLKDVAFRVVPFGKIEAQRLIEDIKGQQILGGFRGFEADKDSLIQTLCAIQKLAPLVKEIDINPLITNQEGSFAVDARIILY